jgi:hypothetical protein
MRVSNQTLTGVGLDAIGDNNTLTGPGCSATGDNNTLISLNCRARGQNNTVRLGGGSSSSSSSWSMSIGGGRVGMTRVIGNVGDAGTVVMAKKKKRKEPEESFIEGPPPEDAQHDKVAEEGAPTCVICMENVPCCIAAPCNHLSFCVRCARFLCFADAESAPKKAGTLQCPQCRMSVESMKRVFHSCISSTFSHARIWASHQSGSVSWGR